MRPGTLRRALPPVLIALALALALAAPASAFERLAQYGTGLPGAGSGQISLASGVAVAPDGTVAVTDLGNQRLALFDRTGKFLAAVGKDVTIGGIEGAETCTTACKAGAAGAAAGELSSPFSVAAGTEIYVAEVGNHRISVFDLSGKFLRAFGTDVGGAGVDVCTAICATGKAGAASGDLASPAGLALDASGRLYVGELGTNRIDVFDPKTGKFLMAFGKNVGGAGVHTCTAACGPGAADGTPGSLSLPYGVNAAANGEVTVSENGGGRLSVFSSAGKFLRVLGSAGEGAEQLAAPAGVAVGGGGDAYVGDMGNNRLAVFTAGGGFRAYGLDVVPGGLVAPEVCTNPCKKGVAGFGIGEFSSPWGVGLDCRGAIYVGSTGRIERWGEPGTPLPPCPAPAPEVVPPSNDFGFGKLRRNRKKGIVTVEVTVPGPGALSAAVGRKLKASVPQPAAAGTVRVRVRAAGKGVRVLSRRGRLKTTLRVTFTPTDGTPNTRSRKVTLVKKLKRKRTGGAGPGRGARR